MKIREPAAQRLRLQLRHNAALRGEAGVARDAVAERQAAQEVARVRQRRRAVDQRIAGRDIDITAVFPARFKPAV